MATSARNVRDGLKVDPKRAALFDKGKIPKAKTSESPVSGQSYAGWFRDPYDGAEYWCYDLHYGPNFRIDSEGNVFEIDVY